MEAHEEARDQITRQMEVSYTHASVGLVAAVVVVVLLRSLSVVAVIVLIEQAHEQ